MLAGDAGAAPRPRARDGICPIEEAAAYGRLSHCGYDSEEIGCRVGQSRAHVYARRKLLELAPELRELVLVDRLDATLATAIARLAPIAQLECWEALQAELPDASFRVAAAFVRSFEPSPIVLDLVLEEGPTRIDIDLRETPKKKTKQAPDLKTKQAPDLEFADLVDQVLERLPSAPAIDKPAIDKREGKRVTSAGGRVEIFAMSSSSSSSAVSRPAWTAALEAAPYTVRTQKKIRARQ